MIAMYSFQEKSKAILDVFNNNAETLGMMLRSEVFVVTQELKTGMVDTLSRSIPSYFLTCQGAEP